MAYTGTRNKYFDYFDHQADIGIIGIGNTLSDAFIEGAKAVFDVMSDITTIYHKLTVKITVEASDKEALFVEWLNLLLAHKDIDNILFYDFVVDIIESKGKYILYGFAKGEELDKHRHCLKTEVKAATYNMLKISKHNNFFKVCCVIDV